MQIGETIKVRLTSESGTNLLFFQTAYQYMLGRLLKKCGYRITDYASPINL